MVVQNVVFENSICDKDELYFRGEQRHIVKKSEKSIVMAGQTSLTTDTYMNLFDSAAWGKYTDISSWKVCFWAEGKGNIKVIRSCNNQDIVLGAQGISTKEKSYYEISFEKADTGYVYLQFETNTKLAVYECRFETNKTVVSNEVVLAVIICTYKRNADVTRNIKTLMNSDFFRDNKELKNKLHIYVVDNASELTIPENERLHIFHNPNTGGSGGFSRGMEEVRKKESKDKTTSVVLMDDDVRLTVETFYRLYALLELISEEYQNEVIAGRMFRMDEREMQYTAAEIWNCGNIVHCGFLADMTKKEALTNVNDNTNAQYSGWWFACYPMKFVRDNIPEQYFLHCDDVEYGLRHGGTPIILNGIQVWHETYEYRQSPVMAYYDVRNRMAVNKKYGLLSPESCQAFLTEWKQSITLAHIEKGYLYEYMMIKGLWDFLRNRCGESAGTEARRHKRLEKIRTCKIKNAVMWRVVWYMYAKLVEDM